MAKIFIIIGILFLITGLILYYFGGAFSWFGNLMGDIKISRSNFTFYSPISSMVIISLLLTIIINILLRFIK